MDFPEFESFGSVISFLYSYIERFLIYVAQWLSLTRMGIFERDNRTNTFSFGHDNVMYSWL